MPSSTTHHRLPTVLLLLGVAVAVLVPLLAPVPAQAAPPVPATPKFGAAIEGYAPYQGGVTCDVKDRPGAKKLAKLIRGTYGTASIGIARNACYTTSEHNEGRALDWMLDANKASDKAKADAFLGWLLATVDGQPHAMARRLGVMYIIWNKQMWRSYGTPGWSSYTGSHPHTDHIHISLSVDGATGRTSFWSGKPLAAPCDLPGLASSAPKVVTDPMNYVPVPATRVLSTVRGKGVVNDRCRLFSSGLYGGSPSRLDAVVTGVGGVPAEGVAAVALQVTMRKPNWASYLTAGPAGGAISDVRRVSAELNATSSTLVVVPVGADGKVSFRTSAGATDVVAEVVGYYLDPNAPRTLLRNISATGGDAYDPVNPRRVLNGSAKQVGAGSTQRLAVTEQRGVDDAASAAVVSVTVRPSAGSGAVYAYPTGSTRPKTPLLEYTSGRIRTVQTVVPLGSNGRLVVENRGKKAKQIDVDLLGAYEPAGKPGGLSYAARKSDRTVVNTRKGLGIKRLDSGKTGTVSLAGLVPSDARGVLLQVSIRKPSAATWLTFWRADQARPGTVDLSAHAKEVVTGTVAAELSPDQRLKIGNVGANNVDLTISLLGSFR